jgi:hypothetical protein
MSASRFARFWSSYKANVIPSTIFIVSSSVGVSSSLAITENVRRNEPINYKQLGKAVGGASLLGAAAGVIYPISVPAIYAWCGYELYQYSKTH